MSEHDELHLRDMEDLSKKYIAEGIDYYEGTLNESCPKFKLRLFVRHSIRELEWASVNKRNISILGFIEYPMRPLLNMNLVMFYGYVPQFVFTATFIEEMVHLKRGFNEINDHDEQFLRIMAKFPEFEESEQWKKQNIMMSIAFANYLDLKYGELRI